MTANDPSSRADSSRTQQGRYWRSLAELQQSEEFNEYLHREFPVAASEFPEGVSRRRWMQLMGASFALAGVAGCRYPEELIAPFVVRPEGRVPGEFYHRATNFELAGRVYNLLVKCVDGRPIKVEPNTEHPSGGPTDVYAQASMLCLYDPDRSRGEEGPIVRREEGEPTRHVGWDAFETFGPALVRTAAGNGDGQGFAVLTPPTFSPTVLRTLGRLKERLPGATVARYDGVVGDTMREATRREFGEPGRQSLNLDRAKVVVSIQADILGTDPGFLHNSKSFAANRDPVEGNGSMSRLYVVEGGYTSTGATADSRLAMRPGQMPALISEIGRRLAEHDGGDGEISTFDPEQMPETAFDELPADERLSRFIDAAVDDLAAAGDHGVVVVGDSLGEQAVAAGIRINRQLGSLGTIQQFRGEPEAEVGETVTLSELVNEIDAGKIDSLLILGGNPVFTAPGDVDLASALEKVERTIYLGEYDDETGLLCQWSLPLAHPLESWGDVVDDLGYYGVCQPQILPLLGGRSIPEVLAVMLGDSETRGDQLVRRTADDIGGTSLSDRQWRKLLHDGFLVDENDFPEGLTFGRLLEPGSGEFEPLTDEGPAAVTEADQDDIEILFVPSDGIYDGRFANNGWLQEMPQALTKLTWDNAAVMSPKTAAALKIRHGVMVALRRDGRLVELPVYEMPGCAPGVVTVPFGYGRERAGTVGGWAERDIGAVGTDVSEIRTSGSMRIAYQMEARPRYTEFELATTQAHWAIDELGRDEAEGRSYSLVREGTTALFDKIPEFAAAKGPHVPEVGKTGSPFEEPINRVERTEPDVPQWGMSVDLTKCIGCNACVVACQSENNVPIVGKEQVINSREMHWLRVDRYFQGDEENADVVQQPVACMHCETAPCEQVCPVAATVHTDDGINAMAYNRCIGTRYCANNCPFKVRRFNYFNYNEDVGVGYGINAFPASIENANRKLQQLVLNPDVTVRGRGVMEKCTYCVQRVEQAKIEARREGDGEIADGAVVTACQAACPTNAIEFGNVGDADSKVAKKHADIRSYGMLAQLNVKPRTRYLARIRNTHPMLMTRVQLTDLTELEPPHHHAGHEAAHGEESHGEGGRGSHGEDGHGGEGHGGEHGEPGHGEAAAAESGAESH